MEYRQAMGFVNYTDQKKLLPNFFEFKLNKRGVSFLRECIAYYYRGRGCKVVKMVLDQRTRRQFIAVSCGYDT